MASTIQYLERYSLLAITGLSTKDERHGDDDGQGGQDTSLRDEWIERANAALNPKVLAETWALGVAEIREAGSMDDYHAFKGNAYGLANTLLQTAFLKPKLRNKHIKNLFYTGQLTVPGPGVPPSIISGQVVAREVKKGLAG